MSWSGIWVHVYLQTELSLLAREWTIEKGYQKDLKSAVAHVGNYKEIEAQSCCPTKTYWSLHQSRLENVSQLAYILQKQQKEWKTLWSQFHP